MNRSDRLIAPAWMVLTVATCLTAYLYTFSEWLFFVTKPSFMSGMTIGSQIRIFLLSALGVCVIPLVSMGVLTLADRILHRSNISSLLVNIGILIPTLIISSLFLLLVDNFTYTVTGFGIVSTERFLRALYGVSFIGVCIFVWLRLRSYVQVRGAKKYPVRKVQRRLLTVLLVVSVFFSIVENFTSKTPVFLAAEDPAKADGLPNIILLGSDGLDAMRFSAYGYERDTTPNIRAKLTDALMAENAFPNGGTTAGSIASILTGKLPIATRVIYPPDILRGEDSYQHLPGILKRLGYHTVDLSVPYYGDALTLNMLDSFELVNQRSGTDGFLLQIARVVGGGDGAYFVDTMYRRLFERLLHIFFLKPMINPFEVVIEPADRGDERERLDRLISTLADSTAPVFVHVHMLGTHGPRFEISQPVFSAGQTQPGDWMPDFYDDSILEFDRYVGELFDYLSESGKLQNTLVILYSDHGRQWTIHQRVPLIFWFPGGEYAGNIHASVQNIDIAPTVLDYLDIPIPGWMDGQSLLRPGVQAPDSIFSASVEASLIEISDEGIWSVQMERASPPFYQVGYVGLVACNQWYELYLHSPGLLYGEVNGYTEPCDLSTVPSVTQAKQVLLDHLSQHGFDISTFPDSIPMRQVQ